MVSETKMRDGRNPIDGAARCMSCKNVAKFMCDYAIPPSSETENKVKLCRALLCDVHRIRVNNMDLCRQHAGRVQK